MTTAEFGAVSRQSSCQTASTAVVASLKTAVLAIGLSALFLPSPARAQYPTSPPAPAPLRPTQFPAFAKGRLPGGVDVLIVEHHKQPVVTVALATQAGATYEPSDKTGLADLVAELITKGTERRTADQIAAQVEGAGGSISAYADNDFLVITVSALAENLTQAMDVLADVVTHSTFPASELELARTRALSSLQLELSDPGSIAQRAFRHEVYGEHPYGRNATPGSLRAITRDDVLAFFKSRVKPAGALLVVAGDVNPVTARRLAARALAAWRGGEATSPPTAPLPSRLSTQIVLVHKPGAVQSNILAGFPFITPRDPAVYPLTVMDRILGGGADARLFLILREQKSWTYGAYTRFTRPRGTGMFFANAEVRTPVTDSALAEILHQLERMRNEVPADSEVTAAKNYLVGSFPLSIQTPEQIANAVASARLLGLPDDYVPRFRDRLAAVTGAELAAADQRYLTTDRMVIVVVGDATKILDGVKRLGPVRIVDVEGKPLTEAALTAPPSVVQWAVDRLAPGSFSYRVLVQGNPLGQAMHVIQRATEGDRPVLRLTASTSIASFVQENDSILMDAASLAPISIRQSGTAGGQQEFVTLDYDGVHVKGHVHVPQRTGVRDAAVDTTLAAGTFDDNQITPLLLALPLAAGARWTVNAFASSDGVVRTLAVSVAGDSTVTVPAGTFDCWKVEMTGGQVPMSFYITKAAPYLIVRYELVGTPIAFELTQHTP
jgi:zinc protease